MYPGFTSVPAIDKCFAILELLARSKEPMGISDISRNLDLSKSTVFNIAHTLAGLNVLENRLDGKFAFGARFYILGNIAAKRSALMQTAHLYLETINEKTGLSAFLGLRSGCRVVLADKVDSTCEVKLSSEIGTEMPVLAGAGIKAMLSQLSDEEIDEILAQCELRKYTPCSIVDKGAYKKEVLDVRTQGIAYDRQEYMEGMVAFAIPIKANARDIQAAIWAVGQTRQVPDSSIPELTEFLKRISDEINYRLD
jgi:DNA-binding IclR family transcriptional regulator